MGMPIWSHVRVVSDGKKTKSSPLPFAIAMDCDYDGGIAAALRLDTIFGVQVWFFARLHLLKAPMYIIFEDRYGYFGFSDLRNLKIDARVMVGQWEWAWLNWMTRRLVLPAYFKSKFLMPRMKSQWMCGRPAKPPYPWDDAVAKDPEFMYSWTTPKPSI